MQNVLLTVGLICLVGAIVGGGLKLLGGELPALESGKRQLLLGFLGAALIAWAAVYPDPGASDQSTDTSFGLASDSALATDAPSPDATTEAAATATTDGGSDQLDAVSTPSDASSDHVNLKDEYNTNLARITEIERGIGENDQRAKFLQGKLTDQENLIALQRGRVARGEGSPQDQQQALAAITAAEDMNRQVAAALSDFDAARARLLAEKGRLEQRNDAIRSLVQ